MMSSFCVLRMDVESMSLMQDVSAGWLVVRFNSCNSDLVARSGILGVYNVSELLQHHALKLKEATIKIIRDFANPQSFMPFTKKQRFLGFSISHLFCGTSVVFSPKRFKNHNDNKFEGKTLQNLWYLFVQFLSCSSKAPIPQV